jgi:predicted metalloprotease with PDZ domain
MCLDIKLPCVVQWQLWHPGPHQGSWKRIWKEKAFNDEDLFPKITALTYPQIGDFLNSYVAGPNPLPYEEVFSMVGVNYEKEKSTTAFSFGHISLGENQATKRNVITDISNMNEFGKAVGYRPEDEIVSINNTPITVDNFASFRASWLATVKQGDPFSVVVLRKNNKASRKK